MLLHEIKDAPLICVHSETIYTTTPFINEVILNNTVEGNEIHWFCYDLCAKDLLKEFSIESTSIHFHDCFPRNLSFKGSGTNEVFEFLSQKSVEPPPKKLIIIIDSFSTVLLSENDSTVNHLLHRICGNPTVNAGKTPLQILVTIHPNTFVNSSTALTHLRYLTKVWIKIDSKVVTMKMRKSSGKLVMKAYEYTTNVKGKMSLSKKPVTIEESEHRKLHDEESNLMISTFKLDLTEQEKKARDAVQLPYIRSHNDGEKVPASTIHYEPDEYDDWDEEDPDNDLEFV